MTVDINTIFTPDPNNITLSSAAMTQAGGIYSIAGSLGSAVTGCSLSADYVTTSASNWNLTPNFNGVEVTGDIMMNGKSITDRLEKIEQHLGIVQRNEALESKWSKLKALGERYRAMEADILEKEKVWEIIKR